MFKNPLNFRFCIFCCRQNELKNINSGKLFYCRQLLPESSVTAVIVAAYILKFYILVTFHLYAYFCKQEGQIPYPIGIPDKLAL